MAHASLPDAPPLSTLYSQVFARHSGKVSFFVASSALLPVVRQLLPVQELYQPVVFGFLFACQLTVWIVFVGCVAVFADEVRLARPVIRLGRGILTTGAVGALLLCLYVLLSTGFASLCGMAALISPAGVLIREQTSFGAIDVVYGIQAVSSTAVHTALYVGMLLVVSVICQYRTTISFGIGALLALARRPVFPQLLGWSGLIAGLCLLNEWALQQLNMVADARPAPGEVALAGLFLALTAFPELLALLALLRVVWIGLGGTADEPPPVLSRRGLDG